MGAALAVAVWLTAATDAGTTHYALTHGLREVNPLMQVVGVEAHPSRAWLVKGAAAWAVMASTRKLKPKQQAWARGAVAVLWGAVSVWNWRQIQQHSR